MARPAYKITPEILAKVEMLASRGLTNDQVAISLGWNPDTLYKKKRTNTEFSEAIKRGQVKGLTQVSNSLFNDAINGNTVAQIFYLKTRDRKQWNDGVMVDMEIGAPMQITFKVADPISEIKVTKGDEKNQKNKK